MKILKTNKNYFFANFLLILVALFASVGMVELYLRVQHSYAHKLLRQTYDDRELCHDYAKQSDLVYTYVPGRCGHNSQGYPDIEHTSKKAKNIFRIVIIGDSIARGHGVGVPQSFGKQLERKLQQEVGDSQNRRAEVILLARSGYSTSQELILLEQEAYQYHPDLLLWSYALNDPAHPVYHNANGEIGLYFHRPLFHVWDLFARRRFNQQEIEKGKACNPEYHEFLHCVYWTQVEAHLDQIAASVTEKKVPTFFLIHPIFQWEGVFDHYSLDTLHQRIQTRAISAGLEVIDFLEAYKPYRSDDLRILGLDWFDPWHPNEKGHLVMAEFLFERIVAQFNRELEIK